MSVVRRFLVAPSLVRLIRKERGGSRITEGYFAPQAGRTSFVRIDGQDCHLILVTKDAKGRPKEERTEVPRAHGDALLDVCAGKAAYERTTIPLGGRDVLIDRYVTPAGLDIASIDFDDEAAAKDFAPPAWFGTDVSTDEAYERHTVAISGMPKAGEVPLSNAGLNAVLDLLEPRFGFGGASSQVRSSPSPAVASAPTAPKTADAPKPPAAPPEPPKVQAAPPAAAPKTPSPPPAAQSEEPGKQAAPSAAPKPVPAPAASGPTAAAVPAGTPKSPPPPAAPSPPASAAAVPPNPAPSAATPAAAVASATPSEAPKPAPAAASTQEAPKPGEASATPEADAKTDARIDDVIESLSQALSAAIQQPREPARDEDLGAAFERWTVRPRRTNQQN